MRRAVGQPSSQVRLSGNLIAPTEFPVARTYTCPLADGSGPCHWPTNCTQRRSSTPQGSQYLLLESGAPTGFMEPTQASPDGREHLTQLEARQMCVSALSAKPGAWASYFTLPSVCKLKGKMHVGIHQTQRGDWPGGLDEITTAAWPRARSTLHPRDWSSLDSLLTWLGGRSHPLHHSKVQEAQGVQIAGALEAAWQREFPGRCGLPHQCLSHG